MIAFTKLLFYQMARKAPRIYIFNHVARIRSYHRSITMKVYNGDHSNYLFLLEAFHSITMTASKQPLPLHTGQLILRRSFPSNPQNHPFPAQRLQV